VDSVSPHPKNINGLGGASEMLAMQLVSAESILVLKRVFVFYIFFSHCGAW
jgi:hypothetical protein